MNKNITKNRDLINALCIGSLCSLSYLAVYFDRNILGAVSPQMLENGYSEVFLGDVSSAFFLFYAVGQLINGVIGDKIKAKYMISIGLFMAGVTNILFPYFSVISENVAIFIYGMTGFFLSMIYGPMIKVVAENTTPVYASRCSLGYNFSSFFGSPLAGIAAAALLWKAVFNLGSVFLVIMAIVCFGFFSFFEKKGIVSRRLPSEKEKTAGGIKLLLKRSIVKFTLISIITGVVRTTVVFWLPTYISQYLNFDAKQAAGIFTVATLIISFTTFISIFVYEKLNRNMNLVLTLMFSFSAVFFLLLYFMCTPVINLICIVLAIMSSNGAATMLWSVYCVSLKDTGHVSGATGFLDFVSYAAAGLASNLFADAVTTIGWGNLILIWFALMICGIIVSLPFERIKRKI